MTECKGCKQEFIRDEMIVTLLPKLRLRLCLECAREVKKELEKPMSAELKALSEVDDMIARHEEDEDAYLLSMGLLE